MAPFDVDAEAAAGKRVTKPRPGHADLAGGMKYGARDLRDALERASARESAARVAAGAVCKLLLRECGIEVKSGVLSVGSAADTASPRTFASLERVREDSPLRALDPQVEKRMVEEVDTARQQGETLGGTILVGARGVPAGLGSFASWDRKLDGRIGQALLSVPAVKAVEFGSAVEAARGPGSRAHDEIEKGPDGRLRRRTNRAGGLEAGVTNGEDVIVLVTMKPISTLARGLDSIDLETGEPARSAYERSDVAAVPACGVIAESMLAFVLSDALLEVAGGDRIEAHHEYDRNGCGRNFCSVRSRWSGSNNDVDWALHQLGRLRWQTIILTIREAVLDHDVATLNISGFFQPPAKCSYQMCSLRLRYCAEKADNRH